MARREETLRERTMRRTLEAQAKRLKKKPKAKPKVIQEEPEESQKMREAGCGHLVPSKRGRPPKLCPECK